MTKNENKEGLELYIHIPFCIQKCKYCDFLSAPAPKQVQNAYMEAVLEEVRGKGQDAAADRRVISVFVGGGTPSVVETGWIPRLMGRIRDCYTLAEDVEISMEVNPGTVTAESLRVYREAGVNRLSIGCQSACDAELERIGRIHDFRDFQDAYRWAREAGFGNVNVDLIGGLPGQTLQGWEDTLKEILALEPVPEHISAYSLIVEEGTLFYRMQEMGQLELPDEDEEREMYWKTAEILQNYGYEHYEISNYARRTYRCRHNCGYWRRRDYLGFGIGAASLYNNERYKNTDSLAEYLENPLDCQTEQQILGLEDQMEETMFLGLRMAEGVDMRGFQENFGVSMEEVYGEQIRESMAEGLLEMHGGCLVLTGRGVDLANYVMAKFLR